MDWPPAHLLSAFHAELRLSSPECDAFRFRKNGEDRVVRVQGTPAWLVTPEIMISPPFAKGLVLLRLTVTVLLESL